MNYQLSSCAKAGHDEGGYIIASEFLIAARRICGLLLCYIFDYFFEGMIIYQCLILIVSIGAFVDCLIIHYQVHWFEDKIKTKY